MLRLYKMTIPEHKVGKSFRFDFPMQGNGNEIVGVFAVLSNATDEPYFNPNLSQAYEESKLIKLSVSTDGRVIAPSVDVNMVFPPTTTAKNLCVPVDFEKVGNKITFVIEEYTNTFPKMIRSIGEINSMGYEVCVYLKSKEK